MLDLTSSRGAGEWSLANQSIQSPARNFHIESDRRKAMRLKKDKD